MATGSTVNYANTNIDLSVRVFDDFYNYDVNVPAAEYDLFDAESTPRVAVFYTIWSYRSGAGRELLLAAVDHIKRNRPNVQRFVTLSPKTEMAYRFHINNGARVLRENAVTINYEYC